LAGFVRTSKEINAWLTRCGGGLKHGGNLCGKTLAIERKTPYTVDMKKRLLHFVTLGVTAVTFGVTLQAQSLSVGARAALVSWNEKFAPLPLWGTRIHPAGDIDVAYKPKDWPLQMNIFVEAGADPHRTGEATSISVGMRADVYRHGQLKGNPRMPKFAVTAEAAIGVYEAPSFNAQCGGYEEQYDCEAAHKVPVMYPGGTPGGPLVYRPGVGLVTFRTTLTPPEECFWASTNIGIGTRYAVSKRFALEPVKVEYLSPYGIGPRWRISAGFRVYLK